MVAEKKTTEFTNRAKSFDGHFLALVRRFGKGFEKGRIMSAKKSSE